MGKRTTIALRWTLLFGTLTTVLSSVEARAQSCSVTTTWQENGSQSPGCPQFGLTLYYLCGASGSFHATCTGPTYTEFCGGCNPPYPPEPDCSGCEQSLYPGPDGPPCVYKGDPVHAGSGVFLSEPLVDVRYEGSDVPLEYVRYYASSHHWLPPDNGNMFPTETQRVGAGWTSTFDERLYDDTGFAAVQEVVEDEELDLSVIHRLPNGRGRRFLCPAPHDPASAFDCLTDDSSLDVLSWDPGSPDHWSLFSPAARTFTTFAADGALERKENAEGTEFWEVSYDSGHLALAEDHLGRVIRFEFDEFPGGGGYHLVALWDAATGGNQLAAYEQDQRMYLLSATTTSSAEEYEYSATYSDASLPYITAIVRDGETVTSITYDNWEWSPGQGRVRRLVGTDGSYAFRYPGEEDNTCTNDGTSSMVIDLSSDPLPLVSCDEDSDCGTPPSGTFYACDLVAEACRVAECIEFFDDTSVLDYSAPVAIAGNCSSCGESYQWTTPSGEARRAISVATSRRGLVTTQAHDAYGRLVARCEGDDDEEVDYDDPGSCPATGTYMDWYYGSATWRDRAASR